MSVQLSEQRGDRRVACALRGDVLAALRDLPLVVGLRRLEREIARRRLRVEVLAARRHVLAALRDSAGVAGLSEVALAVRLGDRLLARRVAELALSGGEDVLRAAHFRAAAEHAAAGERTPQRRETAGGFLADLILRPREDVGLRAGVVRHRDRDGRGRRRAAVAWPAGGIGEITTPPIPVDRPAAAPHFFGAVEQPEQLVAQLLALALLVERVFARPDVLRQPRRTWVVGIAPRRGGQIRAWGRSALSGHDVS